MCLCLPLQPPTGTDTMVKAGVSTNISTKHQCITAMKEYESKSLEVSTKNELDTFMIHKHSFFKYLILFKIKWFKLGLSKSFTLIKVFFKIIYYYEYFYFRLR